MGDLTVAQWGAALPSCSVLPDGKVVDQPFNEITCENHKESSLYLAFFHLLFSGKPQETESEAEADGSARNQKKEEAKSRNG